MDDKDFERALECVLTTHLENRFVSDLAFFAVGTIATTLEP